MRVIEQVAEGLLDGEIYAGDITYIPHLNVVFSFISKNASTSLKTMLSERLGPLVGYNLDPNPHWVVQSGFQNLHNIGAERMEQLLFDTAVPKIAVVREPFERLKSAYSSRIRRWQENDFKESGTQTQRLPLVGPIAGTSMGMHSVPIRKAGRFDPSFDDLVQYVCKTPTALLDRHLAPQVQLIAADRLRYDLVGKFEYLEEFWRDLHDLLGIDPGSAELIWRNRTHSRLPSIHERELRGQVEERYAADYELFSYPRQGQSS